jgi:hypothetical protein
VTFRATGSAVRASDRDSHVSPPVKSLRSCNEEPGTALAVRTALASSRIRAKFDLVDRLRFDTVQSLSEYMPVHLANRGNNPEVLHLTVTVLLLGLIILYQIAVACSAIQADAVNLV